MSVATNANTDVDAAAWHAISADQVLDRLATNGQKGLNAAEVSTRLRKHGPNRLPDGKKRGPFMRFLPSSTTSWSMSSSAPASPS